MKRENKKGMIEPTNLIIGIVAIVGVIAFFVNQPNIGLVFLIISTLIDAITKLVK